MTSPSRRFGVREFAFGAAAIIVPVLACTVPLPTDVQEDADAPVADAPVSDAPDPAAGPAFTPYETAPRLRNTAVIQQALEAEYPPLLRDAGIGGTVRVHFYVPAEGGTGRVELDESSGHQQLDLAALRVAERIEFDPATNDGEPVAVWVSFPITFQVR